MASSNESDSSSGSSSRLQLIQEALESIKETEAVGSKFENELRGHYMSTDQFNHLPPNQRKVAVAYSMITSGRKASDFTCISPNLLLNLMKINVPEVHPGKEDILTATFGISEDPTSQGVYFIRSDQYLSFVLLKNWFTQKAQHPEDDPNIEAVTDFSNLKLGQVVIAPTPMRPSQVQEDREYHRAVVRKLLTERDEVEVQFCDLGAVEAVDMNSLFKYDHPLMSLEELPPLSFFAHPEGVDMSAYSQDHKPVLFNALTEMFRRSFRDSVKCKVISCSPNPNEPVRVQITFKNPHLGEQSFEKFWQEYLKWHNPKKRDVVLKAIMDSACTTIKAGEINLKKVCRHLVELVHVDRDSDAIYVMNDPDEALKKKLEQMQKYYSSQKCLNSVSKRTIIKQDCAVAWLNKEERIWHRGVVIEHGNQGAKTVLWLVDIGRTATVSVEELRNLDKKFCFPTSLIRIKLAHVKALDTAEVQNYLEQNYAVGTEFRSLPLRKVKLNLDPQDYKVRFVKFAYEMILAESGKKASGELGVTVQTKLWLAGLVEAEGPAASTFRRFFPEIPRYLIASLRPQCPIRKINFEEPDQVEIPHQIKRCLSPVCISYEGSGPSDFYIQNVHQQDQLLTMELYLNNEEKYGLLKKVDAETKFEIGDLALFPTEKNDYHGSRKTHCRVLIIGTNISTSTFTGLAIDYGEPYENMERKLLRLIPEKVRKIPPMCKRVHLELPTGYRPAELTGFSYTTSLAWLKFIRSWQDLGTKYWAWNLHRKDSTVLLSELQQKLAFDGLGRKWIPGQLAKYDAYQEVNRLWETSKYSNVHLAPFFSSTGVSLSYHEFVEHDAQHHSMEFPNLLEFLIKREFVVKA